MKKQQHHQIANRVAQPSGAASPRGSDAHKRIAVPKALCVLREYPRPRPKSGKVHLSDTRPGDVCERAKRSEVSNSAPIRNAPVSACGPLCARLGAGMALCTRRSPLKRMLRRLWAMCERVRCILLRQWETEPFGMDVSLPAMPRFGGFRPLFARSIKAQIKRGARNWAPLSHKAPQCGAFRDFETAV